jgi:ubiquinone/menaquinone biosynthesis C-methylase UbiE
MWERERRSVIHYFAEDIYKVELERDFGLKEIGSGFLNNMGNSHTKYDAVMEILSGIDFNSILDVGCKDGELLSRLVEERKISAFGVDNSEEMIEAARKRLGNGVEIFACDYKKLPWGKNSFDVVVCNGLFCRFSDPEGVIHEMKRVIRHCGIFIITGVGRTGRIRRLFDFVVRSQGSSDLRVYSRDEVIDLLGRSGFFVEDWQDTKNRGFVLCALAIR